MLFLWTELALYEPGGWPMPIHKTKASVWKSLVWERVVLAGITRQGHLCFLLQCKNLPVSGRGAGDLCVGHAVRGERSHIGRALHLCFCTWPRGKPWWCHQGQFNKCPLFSHSSALLKSCHRTRSFSLCLFPSPFWLYKTESSHFGLMAEETGRVFP